MKKYKLTIVITLLLLGILSISYGFFSFYQISNVKTSLVSGDIYLRLDNEIDSISITNAFPEDSVSARAKNDNTLEFSVYGKNESSDDIYYEIFLTHGDSVSGKDRIHDEDLAFDLLRVNDNGTEEMLLDAVSYEELNNHKIWVDYVEKNTNTEVTQKYKLRMWLAKKLTYGEGEDANYTNEEFENSYASIRVGVDGKVSEKSFPMQFAYVNAENKFLVTLKK